MTPLETYLRQLSFIRSSGVGVKETSYYPAINTLLDAVGKGLKPRVRCIVHPRSVGAGIPDVGLYTQDQLPRGAEQPSDLAMVPARGVVEVKGANEDITRIAASPQVLILQRRFMDS